MAGVDHPFAIVPCLMLAEVRATSVVVYAVLAEHANADQECWPSIRRIAERANVTPNTVRSAVKELEEKGWLTVRGRLTEEGRQTSNLFKIRRVRNSDVTPQISGGSPLKKHNPPPSESGRGTRPTESDLKNSAKRRYSTAAETREMLDANQTDDPVDDLGDRVRSARDELRR
ncbi:MAG: helix-turn-helix domain-containing protein [Ilumatobacteraceae bacterium]